MNEKKILEIIEMVATSGYQKLTNHTKHGLLNGTYHQKLKFIRYFLYRYDLMRLLHVEFKVFEGKTYRNCQFNSQVQV